MRKKKLLGPVCLLAGLAFLGGLAACSDSPNMGTPQQDAGSQLDSTAPPQDSGSTKSDSAKGDGSETGPNWTYVLIDDMETTTHGPIELDAGFDAKVTQGYWYNSGAQVGLDGGGDAADMSDPPQGSFVFTSLPASTTTLNGKASTHAARQHCVLTGLYDTCGVGFEFAQMAVSDGGVPEPAAGDAAAKDATVDGGSGPTDGAPSDGAVADSRAGDSAATDIGDAGPSIPRVTVPFDISRYKGITFWAKTTTVDPTTGSLQVKVQFPDTDTDPRGQICNGNGPNTSMCYNSYAAYLDVTTSWQQFTVLLDTGDGGGAPDGGIAIDTSWGYQQAQWLPAQVYGINWQAQKNTDVDAGPITTEIWVDDVYFIE